MPCVKTSTRNLVFSFLLHISEIWRVPVPASPTSVDFYFEGKFENGVAEGMVDPNLNPIAAFRLSVIQNSAVWAILNEVRQYISEIA